VLYLGRTRLNDGLYKSKPEGRRGVQGRPKQVPGFRGASIAGLSEIRVVNTGCADWKPFGKGRNKGTEEQCASRRAKEVGAGSYASVERTCGSIDRVGRVYQQALEKSRV
jgi:hypothetical protein